jgi:ribosome-binding ATPase YchF (GTP1/OBG family)
VHGQGHIPGVDGHGQVALVGAPNVGKSSLVQLLSSGAPEVCDYPFTTRSIAMGHFFVGGRRHQARRRPASRWDVLVVSPVACLTSALEAVVPM